MKPPKISGSPVRNTKDDAKLPAYRYELFITAFEKKVTEMQRAVRELEKIERLYNIVKEVGEQFRFPNDQSLNFNTSYVRLEYKATQNDTLKKFDELAEAIRQRLFEANLRADREPAMSYVDTAVAYHFTATQGDHVASVYVSVDLPSEGIRDAAISTEVRTYTYHERKVKRLDEERPIDWHLSTK